MYDSAGCCCEHALGCWQLPCNAWHAHQHPGVCSLLPAGYTMCQNVQIWQPAPRAPASYNNINQSHALCYCTVTRCQQQLQPYRASCSLDWCNRFHEVGDHALVVVTAWACRPKEYRSNGQHLLLCMFSAQIETHTLRR